MPRSKRKRFIRMGDPVMYGDLKTQVISYQRDVDGVQCVLVAMVAKYIPVSELKPILQ